LVPSSGELNKVVYTINYCNDSTSSKGNNMSTSKKNKTYGGTRSPQKVIEMNRSAKGSGTVVREYEMQTTPSSSQQGLSNVKENKNYKLGSSDQRHEITMQLSTSV
jgi:hypothetical protein